MARWSGLIKISTRRFLCAAFNSSVGGDRLTGAVTESAQTGAAYATGLQEGGNRFGAVARQWLVDGIVTGVVGCGRLMVKVVSGY